MKTTKFGGNLKKTEELRQKPPSNFAIGAVLSDFPSLLALYYVLRFCVAPRGL